MGLTVGLTFFLHKGERSIWSNGGDQHCAFLWMLLRRCPNVSRVVAINGGDGDAAAPGLMFDRIGIEFVRLDQVVDDLDVLIEAGAQVSAEHVERVHRHGGKAVAFRFGNAYVIDNERVIHGKPSGGIFNGARFDEVWTNAQHMHTCASYWETTYRCPVRALPHIWEPLFVDAAVEQFPQTLSFGYRPGRARKRVAIFEPNHNIVKTCTIPMLVCEQAYRQRPELLGDIFVTNAAQLKQHTTFKHFASSLDIVRDGLASFESRFNAPWFLAQYADAVVSHQWENGLNYAYYDALYGGYPLVHNSDLLPGGIGYRYHGFDAKDGARALIEALETHDARLAEYRDMAGRFLASVRATAPANVDEHGLALANLFVN